MLTLLKPKQHTLLGVDISSTSVKIIEITASKEEYTVKGYGSALLPENVMEGSTIKDIEAVADTIKKILIRQRFSCKEVALAVPDSSAISRIIQINEGLSEEEIEEIVVMEADKYIPYSIDEINLDFEVLGPSAKNSALQDVLIAASRTENVNNRVEAISHAGLNAKIVDVESYAIERAARLLTSQLPESGTNKIVAIIDMGAVYIHFFVLHGLKIIFSHEEQFGSKPLIDAIVEEYAMKPEDAIQALENNTLPAEFKSKVLEPFQKSIMLQVKRGLQFFFSTGQYAAVDQILLAGGVAKYPNIDQLLQEHINIPTAIANPFAHMTFGKSVDKEQITRDAPTLLVACGLALRVP